MTKQYTDAVQTAHLIALGFPTPKSVSKLTLDIDMDTIPTFNYSIGELISLLPRCIKGSGDTAVLTIFYDACDGEWCCGHRWHYSRKWRLCGKDYQMTIYDIELVDALYRYIVELKEEGKI